MTETANREKFTMKNLDNRVEDVLPLIHNIMQEYEPEKKQPTGEPEPKTEPIVDHGAMQLYHAGFVKQFLASRSKKISIKKR